MSRTPDHPVAPLFVDRWSPRSFSGEAIPDDHEVEAIVAIGRQGTLDTLHADFHAGEQPSTRRPLADFVFEGRFGGQTSQPERNAA